MKTNSPKLLVPAACMALASLMALMVSDGRLAAQQTTKAPAEKGTAPKASKEREADRAAIRKTADDFAKAFEAGDAKAIAAHWTDEGELHNEFGDVAVGRAAVEQAYAAAFKANPKSKAEIEVLSIRFPSRDTAIEEGFFRCALPGPSLPTSTRYRALHSREDGVWKIALVNEWGSTEDKLDDLAWLIGTWKATVKDHSVEMTFEWNEAKTLIKNRFIRKEGTKVVSSGTQTIHLDPRNGQIRSAMFDDAGGRGESVWFRDGNRWVLASDSILASGQETTSMNVLTRIGADEILWRSVERSINGQPTPDTEAVKLVRAK